MRTGQKWATHFREWRESRGLTLEQAAERMGITHATLSRIERGKTHYTQGTVEAMAAAYGCEPADLFRAPDPPPDEFTTFVTKLNERKRRQALRILKAALDGEEESA